MATDQPRLNGPHPHGDAERPQLTLRICGSDLERVTFFLGGDLLGPSCLPFQHFTQRCIDGGTRRLRFDLTRLESLDSDGVQALVAVHQRLSAVGGRLLIANANPEVMAVLRTFGRPLLTTSTSVVFAPADSGRGDLRDGRRLSGKPAAGHDVLDDVLPLRHQA
ncbi:MAG TPA: STAS domain-containing protein [Jatrophihabitans sp.]